MTEQIRIYFLNTFEILEMLRKMVFQLRIDMNILIREEGKCYYFWLKAHKLITFDKYKGGDEEGGPGVHYRDRHHRHPGLCLNLCLFHWW